MNKELENKALEIIQKLQTYNPAAGDDPRWFKQCLLDLEDIIIDDEISPKERERLKRIENRKKLGTNMDNTLFVDTCFDRVKIDVVVPNAEVVYEELSVKIENAQDRIMELADRYGVKQIFASDDCISGINVYRTILSSNLSFDSLDIIPFKRESMERK